MKKSEMVELMWKSLMEGHESVSELTKFDADYLLQEMERLGMLPPQQECKFVIDNYWGGTKHGPVLHVWDEENS